MECMGPEKFLKQYELELDKEFEKDGLAARWANDASAHRFFGQEDASVALRNDDPQADRGIDDAEAALSPDGLLLAVSTNAVIRIYHLQSQELRSELIGHTGNISQLHFAPKANVNASASSTTKTNVDDHKIAAYNLLSSSEQGSRGNDHIIAWALDQNGRQVERTMPFAIQDMADRAIEAISSDLTDHHSLSADNIGTIRDSFAENLQVADTKNRAKGLLLLNGEFPSFGTYPSSSDGRSFFYTGCGDTTQHGERPPDELPQIVVFDQQSHAEICRLKGHTDAIMWAGWSPDGDTIATASWDQYHKIWNAHTGECKHTIGPTKRQNWAGAFSPDGKYVLLSGGDDPKVAIYNVESGVLFAKLEKEGLKLADWIRYLDWNPAGDCIAISNDSSILLWYPFEGRIEMILSITTDKSMLKRYNSISVIKWAQGGKKLMLQDTSRTTFVWDRERNVKWRFERPQGMPLKLYTSWVGYIEEGDMVLSLDGDWKVRYWKLS